AFRALLRRPLASYQIVLGSSALLLGIGLIMVLSASSVLALNVYGNAFAIFGRQALFAVVGVGCAYVASRTSIRNLRRLAYPLMIVAGILVAITLIPGIGIEVQGNRNWLPLFGGYRLQPSEFAKLALVIWA